MSVKSLFDPKNPDSYGDRLNGLFVGYVLSVNDPEGLGRVQVCCPIIKPDVPLPNDCDGWIPISTDSTVMDGFGGTTRPISIGTQCTLLPVMGLPESWVVDKFLFSRHSPPHPEFDPVNRIYGTITGGRVYELHDDINFKSIKTYPNGFSMGVSPEGDYTVQHDSGSRFSLKADKSILMENDMGHYGVSPDGIIEMRNKEGGGFTIQKDGHVSMAIAGMAEVKLTPYGFAMSGKPDEVSLLKLGLEKNFNGIIGSGRSYAIALRELAADLRVASEPNAVLEEISRTLADLETVLNKVPEGKSALDKLLAIAAPRLGQGVMGQIDRFRAAGLDKVVENVLERGLEGITVDDIGRVLDQFVPQSILKDANIQPSQLIDIIEGLQHDPQKQLDVLLDAILPDGHESVSAMRGFGIIEQIPGMEIVRTIADMNLDSLLAEVKLDGQTTAADLLSDVEEIAQLLEEIDIDLPIPGFVTAIESYIAQASAIANTVLEEVEKVDALVSQVKGVIDDVSMATGFGNKLLGLAQQLSTGVEESVTDAEAVTLLRIFIDDLLVVSYLDQPSEVISQLQGQVARLNAQFRTSAFASVVLEPGYAHVNDAIGKAQLLADMCRQAIPDAILYLVDRLSANLFEQVPVYQELIQSLPITKQGALRQDGNGFFLGSDDGRSGGSFIADETGTRIFGPGGDRGVGTSLEMGTETLTLLAPGGKQNLGSQVTVSPQSVSVDAPGAKSGLAGSLLADKEGVTVQAPGAKRGIGSLFQVFKDKILAYAPGGDRGLGAWLEVAASYAFLTAPGPNSMGSRVLLETGKATLRGPGGNNAGSLVIEPTKAVLKLPNGPVIELENTTVLPTLSPQKIRQGDEGTVIGAGNLFQATTGATTKIGSAARVKATLGTASIESGSYVGGEFVPIASLSITPLGLSMGFAGLGGGGIQILGQSLLLSAPGAVTRTQLQMSSAGTSLISGNLLQIASGATSAAGTGTLIKSEGGSLSLMSGIWSGSAFASLGGIIIGPGSIRVSALPAVGGIGGGTTLEIIEGGGAYLDGSPFGVPQTPTEIATGLTGLPDPWLPVEKLIGLTGPFVVNLLTGLTGGNRLPYGSIKDTPTTEQTAIALNALASPWLGFSKLTGVPNFLLTSDYTGASIVSRLDALTGAGKLSYNVLKDTPTIPVVLTASETAIALNQLPSPWLDFDQLTNVPDLQAAIADNSITLAMLAQAQSGTLLGRYGTATGNYQVITIGAGLELNGSGVLSATAQGGGGGAGTIYLDNLIDVQIAGLSGMTGAIVLGYDSATQLWKPTNVTAIASINGKSDSVVTLTTQDIQEAGGYLYYSNSRVDTRIGQLSIDALADVNLTGQTDGLILGRQGGVWKPVTVGSLSNLYLNDLLDVEAPAPLNGQTLIYSTANQRWQLGAVAIINSTDDLAQGVRGDRRYYSDSYVDGRISQLSINQFWDVNTSGSVNGQVMKLVGGVWQGADVVLPSNTDDLPQGSRGDRRYYADSYVDTRITQLSINQLGDVDLTGKTVGKVLGFDNSLNLVPVDVLTGSTTTDAIAPGTNAARQYYSNAAVDARIAQTNLSALANVGDNPALGGYTLIYDAGTGLFQPGPTGTISVTLTFQSAGDDKGFVYWCGTEKRLQAFTSPGLKSSPWNITVTLSSNLSATPTSHAIDRNSSTIIHTAGQPNSRCTLDLGVDKLFKPNYYSIRGRGDANTNHPRNWKLQGSADAANWVDLDTQTNNTTIGQGTYFTGSCTAIESYRYLSILQTGVNSSGTDFLVFGEVDFWGQVSIAGVSAATTTDDLPPGEFNKYYGDDLVAAYLATPDIVPTASVQNLSGVNTGDQDLSGLATTSALSSAIAALAGTAPTEGNTLGKLYDLITALSALAGGSTPDGDLIVNTVAEVLAVFANYPEGLNVLTALADKINTSAIVNNLNQTVPGSVLDATQGKILNDAIASKQNTLASGENIKTINGASVLGNGNIAITSVASLSSTTSTEVFNAIASAAIAQKTITLPKIYLLYLISANCECRVRIYRDDASRQSDLNRASSVQILGDHGCYLDAIVRANKGLVRNLAPPITAIAPSNLNYISVTNLTETSQTPSITFTYLPLEN